MTHLLGGNKPKGGERNPSRSIARAPVGVARPLCGEQRFLSGLAVLRLSSCEPPKFQAKAQASVAARHLAELSS